MPTKAGTIAQRLKASSKATPLPRRDDRPNAGERGYDARWQQNRNLFLIHNPLCADCKVRGRTEIASEVHHIVALSKGGARLDSRNLMSLCKTCHNRRTGAERTARAH